ncbi:M4 family metallopeptidase [Benzoatithermus flavus]|uniref:Neutral metalloproteinase n=1 Tax=Benzoatithermus flavus TaxID=3108223 RepID=A0ABU8XT68_9PROT
MCTARHRHTLFCILPPYLLRAIVQNGSPTQRAAASMTLASDATFRQLRATLATQMPPAQRRRRALGLAPVKQRTVYTADHQEILPGTVVRAEGAPATGDPATDEAYDGLGHTWDFYQEVFGRNSIDDEGMPLNATVHYGQNYDNAFWNGRQMVFGDGDGELFNRFTIALDVIGHELAHGVTEDEAQLVYMFQPGALNEHLSDVFGSLVRQRVLGQTAAAADWLIGAGLLSSKVQGVALRSMKAPGTAYDDPVLGKDPQPADMSGFVDTWQDNGGVHINSGIPNRAFYLAATAIGGHAWEKAGRIWYETLRDSRLTTEPKFADFARLTTDVAGRLYGAGSAEQQAVGDAWAQVGVVAVS